MTIKYLITGSGTGLGNYLLNNLDSWPYNRTNNQIFDVKTIIHCAWNRNLQQYQYIQDAINLCNELKSIKHNKLIFISSIDVYPKDNSLHTEHETINKQDILGIYGLTKKIVEEEIQANFPNHLILRCGAFLGKDMYCNNLWAVSQGRPINISCNSSFNLIRYSPILSFIKLAVKEDLTGIYNIVASDNIKLKDLAVLHNNGKQLFKYKTPKISYEKLLRVAPKLIKQSQYNWNRWLENDI